jgi:hypothetical protein
MAKKNTKKMKYSEEEINAMRINAMLQGLDPNDIKNEELEEDIEIEIEDEKPKKKKKNNEPLVIVPATIEMRPEYEKLKAGGKINITYGGHDIHYKDQLWGIETRVVEYQIELVNIQKVARDCVEKFHGNSAEFKEKASNGEIRYMKVACYLDNIPYRAREVALVEVAYVNGKLKSKLHIDKVQLKQNNINPDKVTDSINKELRKLLA